MGIHTHERDGGDRDSGERADRHGEERARVAVLEVTKSMLNEVGYQDLRVEAVAARAGVPRVWLRRWWTTRPLLVLLFRLGRGEPPTPAVVDALVDLVLGGQAARPEQAVDGHRPDGPRLDGPRLAAGQPAITRHARPRDDGL